FNAIVSTIRLIAISDPIEPASLGIETAPQPCRRDTGETQGQGAPACGIERRRAAIAQQSGAERIRRHQATFVWDQPARKVVWHGEVETVRKFAVGGPLAVGAEIGNRTLDL